MPSHSQHSAKVAEIVATAARDRPGSWPGRPQVRCGTICPRSAHAGPRCQILPSGSLPSGSRPDRLTQPRCSERFGALNSGREDKYGFHVMKNSQTLESVSRAFADLLVAKIESMTQSWHKPWISGNGSFPYNVVSGRSYTGTNALTLLILTEIKGFMSPAYLTFRQAKEPRSRDPQRDRGSSPWSSGSPTMPPPQPATGIPASFRPRISGPPGC